MLSVHFHGMAAHVEDCQRQSVPAIGKGGTAAKQPHMALCAVAVTVYSPVNARKGVG